MCSWSFGSLNLGSREHHLQTASQASAPPPRAVTLWQRTWAASRRGSCGPLLVTVERPPPTPLSKAAHRETSYRKGGPVPLGSHPIPTLSCLLRVAGSQNPLSSHSWCQGWGGGLCGAWTVERQVGWGFPAVVWPQGEGSLQGTGPPPGLGARRSAARFKSAEQLHARPRCRLSIFLLSIPAQKIWGGGGGGHLLKHGFLGLLHKCLQCYRRCRRDRLPTPVFLGLSCGSAGKESICNVGDLGSIPGLGRSPRGGKGYPFQYSGLENSMDCIAHGIAKSWTRLSDFQFHLRR